MQIGTTVALLAGIALSIALIGYHSFASVGRAVWSIGWGLGPIVIVNLVAVLCCGVAWRLLFRPEWPAGTTLLVLLRWVRESVNTLLPVARVGGDIAGVRLLVMRGTGVDLASASVVVDRTVEVLSQLVFALAGAFLLLARGNDLDFVRLAVPGLAVISGVLIVFLAAQRWGLLKVVEKAVRRLAGKSGAASANGAVGIHDIVWAMYKEHRRLAAAMFFHLLGWLHGVVQLWIALHLMGHQTGWTEVFIVESLTQVVCTAAFVMPAALGAQEAAYMVVGGLFGIPPEAGLALSLVKRLSDVLSGVPGLLVWQGLEGRRLWALLKG